MARNWTKLRNDPPAPMPGPQHGLSIWNSIWSSLDPKPLKTTRREFGPETKCCEKFDVKTKRDCVLCGAPCCNYCRGLYNGQWACPPCRDEVKAFVEYEKATWNDFPRALLGGFGMAVVAGVGWSGLAIGSGVRFGIMAVIVGLFAGFGAHLATGRKRGFPVQLAALVCGLFSIMLGQYVISIYSYRVSTGLLVSYFDLSFITYFFTHLEEFFGILDIGFTLSAMAVAFIVPKPRVVAVR